MYLSKFKTLFSNQNNIEVYDGMNRSILDHPYDKNFSPEKGKFKFLVNSFGGNCTSTLIKFLNPKYKDLTNHMWYHLELKHKISPPNYFSHKYKAIYLYGDPRDSLTSIYRRNLQNVHYLNTFQKNKKLPSSIKNFLDNGIDHFKFTEHHLNWTNKKFKKNNFEILVIDSRKIWTHKSQILDFLELPKQKLIDFPKYKTRESTYKELSYTYRQKINIMFESLLKLINERPFFEII